MFVLGDLFGRRVPILVAEMTPEPGGGELSPPSGALESGNPDCVRPANSGPRFAPPPKSRANSTEPLEYGESLAAGFWPRDPSASPGPGSGFASGGLLDRCAPGGPLARLAGAATRDDRLADVDDDELIGVLRARRLAAAHPFARPNAPISGLPAALGSRPVAPGSGEHAD
jgi:hypothetical protein